MLSAKDIFISFNGEPNVNQLDGIAVDFVPGSITAIVGPNGSGKSTLLRVLSRVLEPNKGTVHLDSKDLYTHLNARLSALTIGVVPQDTHVAFDFTVRELVAMGRSPHHTGLSQFTFETFEERLMIDEALSGAQLSPEIASRSVSTLSGGERQRALIARALVQDTKYLLLDEPSSALDLSHQVALFNQLQHLALHRNKSIIIVLHDLTQAASIADRLIVLDQGKIVADGSVEDVLTEPLIQSVYGCQVTIATNPVTGRLVVAPTLLMPTVPDLSGRHIYVICGGGGGSHLLRILVCRGAAVTVAPLNRCDPDVLVAQALNLPVAALPPFDSVPELTPPDCQEIAIKCDSVIFAPASIGDLNMLWIKNALALARTTLPIIAEEKTIELVTRRIQTADDAIQRQWLELCAWFQCRPVTDLNTFLERLPKKQNA